MAVPPKTADIFRMALSVRDASSSGVNLAAAPSFLPRRLHFRVPGMGTNRAFFLCIQGQGKPGLAWRFFRGRSFRKGYEARIFSLPFTGKLGHDGAVIAFFQKAVPAFVGRRQKPFAKGNKAHAGFLKTGKGIHTSGPSWNKRFCMAVTGRTLWARRSILRPLRKGPNG